ncbi:MAG: DUF5522 domain-containing protein [Sporocytophaga sp.]|nr:DUF5522 domain-containing protein [Sporocytophaga sp.]
MNTIRIKTCSRCNTNFSCSTQNCWCNELPPVMSLPEGGDCYCPLCLKSIIKEKLGIDAVAENKNKTEPLREKEDYYYNENGNWVFTAKYLIKRRYCCKNGCKHCPYGFKK